VPTLFSGGNMATLELTPQEMFVSELALRIVLCELLDKEQQRIDDVTAVAHNLKVGSFGDKEFKPEDTNNWIQYLQPMRDMIAKLGPDYKKKSEEFGAEPFYLPEEKDAPME